MCLLYVHVLSLAPRDYSSSSVSLEHILMNSLTLRPIWSLTVILLAPLSAHGFASGFTAAIRTLTCQMSTFEFPCWPSACLGTLACTRPYPVCPVGIVHVYVISLAARPSSSLTLGTLLT